MFSRIHIFKRKQPMMSTVPCPNPDGSSPRQTKFDGPPPMCIDPSKDYRAEMVTSMGTMTISLDSASAPLTVNSFVFLARYHYYEGIVFHRIIKGFVCQGGDPTGTGTGGPGYKFRDELEGDGTYSRGTVAMANSGPNTNGSQFFIMHKDVGLPHSYTIFGKVTDGIEAVDAIAESKTDRSDRPQSEVKISKIEITES